MRHTHISAKHNTFDLKLKEVWQYRELCLMFTRRSFQVVYKQTILGPLWLFINPLLTSIIYVILFGNIAGLSTDGVPQILFYMAGNAIWTFYSGTVSNNANTFIGNQNLFGKVYFPRLVIPISDVLGGLIKFGIQMILVLVLFLFFAVQGQVRPNLLALLFIPLFLVQIGAMGMGFGIIISSLTTKYRDLSVLVSFGLQLWMYATPVVYPLSTVPKSLNLILQLNPMTAPVEAFRLALFGVGTITGISLISTIVFTAFAVIFGIIIFNKVERTFMDTI